MAIAPEEIGIGIRRHFSEPGTHPYDTVEWERRDARIPNYKDGTDAFFQPDVEFPVSWSQNATNIVAQKYFRGTLGTPERESSLRQVIDRVGDTITGWGVRDGYFADDDEAEAFRDELKYVLLHQRAAFNSPVWFNIGVAGVPQQASACFILAVDDTMDAILNWYREEGIIFKGGSGSGVNLSKIRSSREPLQGGGTASGPVSFMRGADASAGTIKSAGKTRRAAKMVILDADHPDIEEFIWCKAREERKARVLRDSGFDMDLDGIDSHSIQYQNANNSVRVTDEFMQAVVDDRDWHLRAVTTGEVVKTVKARELMRQISEASWECADPGMQFDTSINRWHTATNTGRINGSNPCFPGDARVHTDKGLVRFDELVDRVRRGESFDIYTHDATSPDAPAERLELTRPDAVMITGFNEIVKLSFSNGMELRCTPGHSIFTTNRGYVKASELTGADSVKILDLPAPAIAADPRLSGSARLYAVAGRGDKTSRTFQLPEKWTPELAHYVGWLVGDGCISGDVVTTVYGSEDEQEHVLPRHRELAASMNAGRESKPCQLRNGTVQLRQSRRVIARFFEALGVSRKKAPMKVVPAAIYEAPPDAVAAFLRGLFDADGCVHDGRRTLYLGLGSTSRELLLGVQQLLTTFDVFSSIHRTREATEHAFTYSRKDGSTATYSATDLYDLRIANGSIRSFAERVGFSIPRKAVVLEGLVRRNFRSMPKEVRLTQRSEDGVELTFNLSEPRNHSYIVNGFAVRNCSEYMHLDNSACNLASINLLACLRTDDTFDVEAFRQTVEVMFTAQEILVGNADYPTEKIAETSRAFRQLGLGYANLGALLMALGVPYDSPQGRAWAGSLTALMTGHAYTTSARTAGRMGPFAGYADNRAPMLNVLRMHRAEAAKIDEELVPPEVLSAAQRAWDEAVDLAEAYGVRNSQASVLAPTGCLAGGVLVPTARGLVRLRSLGDPDGPRWQRLGIDVGTDEGPRTATHFYVNGLEPVVTIETARGYRLRGTAKHRIKIVDEQGAWVWRRFGDLHAGERVPLALGQLVGQPRLVALPCPRTAQLKPVRAMTPELAELVGYFTGAGSSDSAGLGFWITPEDFDVAEHLSQLGKECFGIDPDVVTDAAHLRVRFDAPGLAEWWRECGFGSAEPLVADRVLESNDRAVYAGFLRGLFESAGGVVGGSPELSTLSSRLSEEVQTLLLALGYAATRRRDALRLPAPASLGCWLDEIGFMGDRKQAAVRPVRKTGDEDSGYIVDLVAKAELGEEDLTYDLSVPSNVTYVANGFVSHNTIGLMMDCDTTGIEPDLALTKAKKLVGGGTMFIVNQTVPRALRRLGYSEEQVERIIAHIDEHKSIVDAPGFNPEHLPVFACSMGDNTIHYMGHVTMLGAVQPFLSGSASKTVNTPEETTVEEIEQLHIEAWKLGLKSVAIYRDNCKVAQPLSTQRKEGASDPLTQQVERIVETVIVQEPVRQKLPRKRNSKTFSFRVADCHGYVTVGEFEDGRPGEVFLKVAKQGSTLAGIMDAFAISVSHGLQYGVPLRAFVDMFTNMRFEPAGMTDDPDIRFATSLVDYIFRRLAVEYLPMAEREEIGILTVDERLQPTLPGVEEAATPSEPGLGVLPPEDRPPSAVLPAAPGEATAQAVAETGGTIGETVLCHVCGDIMQRAGSCYACPSCGATSGCS